MSASAANLLIESHRSWWQLAGLETIVDDVPQNWLAPKADPVPTNASSETPPAARVTDAAPAALSPVAAPIPLAPLAMPEDWSAFQAWLATDPRRPWHPVASAARSAVRRTGARLMLLALTPELADHDAGHLFAGDSGRLLDAMLRAIGLTRDDCYLASLALTRPPGARIDGADMAALNPLLWHHLRLAAPRKLLIFGSDLAQAVLGCDLMAMRGSLRDVNQAGVNVTATATQHPLLLLDRPARKAAAWDSLKLLAQG